MNLKSSKISVPKFEIDLHQFHHLSRVSFTVNKTLDTACILFYLWFVSIPIVTYEVQRSKKLSGSFFIKHKKSFRWHFGDYENISFFNLKACERRNFDFCVFLRVGSLPVKTGLYKRGTDSRADYPPVKTHKNQSFSSHKPSNGKKLCFS